MLLRDVHEAGAWLVIVANGLAGAWALGAHRWPQLRSRALWWATGVAQVAAFVQAALGAAVLADLDAAGRSRLQFHMFYGFLCLVAVGVLYSYRHQLRHRIHLLYGFGGLFIMGLGLRALTIGAR